VSRNHLARLAAVGASALLATLLLGVGAVTATPPAWTATATSVPGSVTPGNYALYVVTVTNNGSSNISQLYLTASVSDLPFSVSPSAGSCTTGGTLFCSLGALRAQGGTDTINVVYKTPSTGSSYDITFQFNTSGSTFTDKKKTSHGDTLNDPVSTPLDGSADFTGGYVVFGGTSFSTATGDVQQTTVSSPTTNIPVTVQESAGGSTSQCASGTPVGELATVNVGGGATFASPFETTLKIATSGLPDESVITDYSLCHHYDSGTLAGTSALLPVCAADVAPTDGHACFFPKWSGTSSAHDRDHNGDADDADNHLFLVLDVWDFQNGGYRGQF
jgi:hypothetical protein